MLKPLPDGEEFRITVDVTAMFTDAEQADGSAKVIREKIEDMFDSWAFIDSFSRNVRVVSRVESTKNAPPAPSLQIRLPPKTVADAIREYQELKHTSPVTLLHKVLDKLIGLTCPHCHKEIGITIE